MFKLTSLRGALRNKLSKQEHKALVYDSVYPIFIKKQKTPLVITGLSGHVHEIDVRYPLIDPFLYANIVWDKEKNELVYKVLEPSLTDEDKKIIDTITEDLMELLEVELSSLTKKTEAVKYLEEHVKRIINEAGINVPRHKYGKIFYYIYRNFIGLNEIEPFMNDPRIEDIGCDGVGVPIYIVHRVFGSIKTNIKFDSLEVLRNLVVKVAERCGRYISYAEPILDGSLPDGSRAHASLSSDITTHGPTLSIRKFKEEPFSPIDIIGVGTASPELMSYLWTTVEHGSSVMICGGVATGKTSLLNCLSMFIRPEQKIVTIEDTRELSLPHENWIPSVSRTGFGIPTATGEKYGEVSLFDLLKGSFRENPDYVIVGEVRGKEAYVMFQGMASIPGSEKVAVLNDDHLKFVPISELTNKRYKTFAIDPETGKISIENVKARVMHPPQKTLLKIKTESGREVIVTPYHSIFTYDSGIKAVEAGKLAKGSRIVVPARLPAGFADSEYIDLTELEGSRIFAPDYLRKAVEKLGFYKASKICGVESISDYYAHFKSKTPSSIKAEKFYALMKEACIDTDKSALKVKFLRKSRMREAMLKITPELLRLFGYYISEGTLNKSGKNSRIALYNKNKEILDDMRHSIASLGIKWGERETKGFGTATELAFSNKVIFGLLKQKCGYSKDKKIPDFMFGLSKEKIGEFLSALFAGDGYYSKHCFGYSTSSKELANQLTYLLLMFGIVAHIIKRTGRSKAENEYEVKFYRRDDREEFLKYARPIGKKAEIKDSKKVRKRDRYGDIFIDTIKSIERLELGNAAPVYDLVIPGKQNFLGGFGGITLHNSGHPSMTTMHADSVEGVIRRLITPPIELPPSLIESLDIIIILSHAREIGKSARRIKEVDEIESMDPVTGKIHHVKAYSWDPITDTYQLKEESVLMRRIAARQGVSYESLIEDMKEKQRIIGWMLQKKTGKFEDVGNMINLYYKDKHALMEWVDKNMEPYSTISKEDIKNLKTTASGMRILGEKTPA